MNLSSRLVTIWILLSIAVAAVAAEFADKGQFEIVGAIILSLTSALLFKYLPLAAGLPSLLALTFATAAGHWHSPEANGFRALLILMGSLGVAYFFYLRQHPS